MRIIAIAVLLFWIGCKSNNTSTSTVKEDKVSETTGSTTTVSETTGSTTSNPLQVKNPDSMITDKKDTNIYRLVVLFHSIGEGVEGKLIKALDQKIRDYSTQTGKEIAYKKSHWGREGETDFVFRLKELNDKEQAEFVNEVKSTLKEGKWVNIYENYAYRYRGK